MGNKLKTVEDVMLSGNKIPYVNQNKKMKEALKILEEKKLGILIVLNKNKDTIGIITDGQIRRMNKKNVNLLKMTAMQIMTKNPISINKNALAAKALSLMNSKKITSLTVYDRKKNKTVGVLHIHNILNANIN